ncbi:hypothetical protein VNI00_005028 [Paramarasmius palmivorus]|uniref:Uncharacterized protein n=1 Tax=Paramarasmius palmivorus TaxID=297713 RepID=A0AAW0DEF5_9AGAR
MNHWGPQSQMHYYQRPQPPPPPRQLVGLSAQYANHHHPITLQLRETVTAMEGDMPIVDVVSGRPLIHCKGKIASPKGRKEFLDPYGNPLFIVKRKTKLSASTTYEGYTPDERILLFTIKSTFAFIEGAKMTASFRNIDGQDVVLSLYGDFKARSVRFTILDVGNANDTPQASILMNGQPVASLARNSPTPAQIVFGGETYYLTVEPGVDAPLIAAICLCIDEKEFENDWTTTAMFWAI